MLVKFYEDMEKFKELDLPQATCLKEILSLTKLAFGQEFTDKLLTEKHAYVLMDTKNPESAVSLSPEILLTSFEGFDLLLVFPEIEGEVTATVVIAALAAISITVGPTTALIIAVVVNLAISLAISAIASALSPTPEFSTDPQVAQSKKNKSNLFNGAPLVVNQGGSVPLIYGNPFCGAVLISSGVFTEET